MRLKRIYCNDILSFKDGFFIELNDLNFIVGPNNSGKTNIIRVFQLINKLLRTRGGYLGDKNIIQSMCRFGEKNKSFKVQLTMELSEDDKQRIIKYLLLIQNNILYEMKRSGGLNLEINSSSIKIAEPQLNNAIVNTEFTTIFSRLWSKFCPILVNELFPENRFNIILSYDGGESSGINLFLGLKGNTIYMDASSRLWTNMNIDRGGTVFTFREFFLGIKNLELNGVDDDKIINILMDQMIRDRKRDIVELKLSFNEIDRLDQDKLKKVLSEIFAFYIDYKENIVIGLLNLFQIWLTNMIIMTSGTQNRNYLNTLPEYLELITNNTEDLSTHLPSLLYYLKNSDNIDDRKLFDNIKVQFSKMTDGLILDVVSRLEWIHMLDIQDGSLSEHSAYRNVMTPGGQINIEKGKVDGYNGLIWMIVTDKTGRINHSLEYAGSGLFELIYILCLILSRKNILIIDEPAANLHPIWQKRIAQLMIEYNINRQSILITHSPYVLPDLTQENMNYIDIHHFRLNSLDLSTIDSYVNLGKGSICCEIKYRKTINKFKTIFFSDVVIVVEGESDERIIREIINEQLVKQNQAILNFEIIDAGGGNNPIKIYKAIKTWMIPVLLIVDNDKKIELKNEGLADQSTIMILYSDLEGTIIIGDLLDIIYKIYDDNRLILKPELKKFGKDSNQKQVRELLMKLKILLEKVILNDQDIIDILSLLVTNPTIVQINERDSIREAIMGRQKDIQEKISYYLKKPYSTINGKIERIIEIINDEENPILKYCPQRITEFLKAQIKNERNTL